MNSLNVNKILLLSCVQALLSTENSHSSESYMSPLKRTLEEFYEDGSVEEQRPTKKSRIDVQKAQNLEKDIHVPQLQHPTNQQVTRWNQAEAYPNDRGGTNPSNLNKNEMTEALESLMLMDSYTSNPESPAEEYSCEIIEEGTIEIKDNTIVQNNITYSRTDPIDSYNLIDYMDWEQEHDSSKQHLGETLYNSEKEQSSNKQHSSNIINIEKPITYLDKIGNIILHQYIANPYIKDSEVSQHLKNKGIEFNSITKLDFIKAYLSCRGYNIPFNNKKGVGKPSKNLNIKDEIEAFFIFKNNPTMSFEDITKSEHYNETQKRTLRFTKEIFERITRKNKKKIYKIPKLHPDTESYRGTQEGATFIRKSDGAINSRYTNLIKIMLFASEIVTREQLSEFIADKGSVFDLYSEKGFGLLAIDDFNSKFEKKSLHKVPTQDRAEDNMDVYSDDTDNATINLLLLLSPNNPVIEKK